MNKFLSFLLFGFLSGTMKALGTQTLSTLFIVFGKAFGPDGLRHFSELSPDEQQILLKEIPVLGKNHTDWPGPLAWVPRTVTTFIGPRPSIIAGNTADPKPIPDNGCWFATRGFFAWTSETGMHIAFGWRYDDVDGYFNFPRLAFKRAN